MPGRTRDGPDDLLVDVVLTRVRDMQRGPEASSYERSAEKLYREAVLWLGSREGARWTGHMDLDHAMFLKTIRWQDHAETLLRENNVSPEEGRLLETSLEAVT